jgi:hypothetical protein
VRADNDRAPFFFGQDVYNAPLLCPSKAKGAGRGRGRGDGSEDASGGANGGGQDSRLGLRLCPVTCIDAYSLPTTYTHMHKSDAWRCGCRYGRTHRPPAQGRPCQHSPCECPAQTPLCLWVRACVRAYVRGQVSWGRHSDGRAAARTVAEPRPQRQAGVRQERALRVHQCIVQRLHVGLRSRDIPCLS